MTDNSQVNGTAPASSETKAEGTANLDALLSEFTEKGKPETKFSPEVAAVLKKVQPALEYVEADRVKRTREETEKSIKSAVDFIREDEAIKEMPEQVVRGMLFDKAAQDASFAAAYENRHSDPKTWQAKLAEARTEAAGIFKPVTISRAPSDVLAARASIAGVSQPKGDADPRPSPEKLFAMSDREFEQTVRGLAASSGR